MAAQIHQQQAIQQPGRRTNAVIRGMADSGFFLHFERTAEFPVDPAAFASRWHFPTPGGREYDLTFAATFELMNMTGGVPPGCLQYMRAAALPAHLCMFPEYAAHFLLTPVFSKQVNLVGYPWPLCALVCLFTCWLTV